MDNSWEHIQTIPSPVIMDQGVSVLGDKVFGTSALYLHSLKHDGPDLVGVKVVPLIAKMREEGAAVHTLGAPFAFGSHVWVCARGNEEAYLVKMGLDLSPEAAYEAPTGSTFYNAEEELVSNHEGLHTFFEQDGGNHSFDLQTTVSLGRINNPGPFSSFHRNQQGSLIASVVHGTSLWVPRVYEIDIDNWVGTRGMDYILGQWDVGHEHHGVCPTKKGVLIPIGREIHYVRLDR